MFCASTGRHTHTVSHDTVKSDRLLALNTEKAHNLRERALEVIRMACSFPLA